MTGLSKSSEQLDRAYLRSLWVRQEQLRILLLVRQVIMMLSQALGDQLQTQYSPAHPTVRLPRFNLLRGIAVRVTRSIRRRLQVFLGVNPLLRM